MVRQIQIPCPKETLSSASGGAARATSGRWVWLPLSWSAPENCDNSLVRSQVSGEFCGRARLWRWPSLA